MVVVTAGGLATMHDILLTRLEIYTWDLSFCILLPVHLHVIFDLTPSFWKPTPRSMQMRVTAKK